MENVKGDDQSNFLIPVGQIDDKKKKKTLADLSPGIPIAPAFTPSNTSSVAFIPPPDPVANARGASVTAFKQDMNAYSSRFLQWQDDVHNIQMRYNSEVDQSLVDYKTAVNNYAKYLQPSQVQDYIETLNYRWDHSLNDGAGMMETFGRFDSMISGKSLTPNERNQLLDSAIIRKIKGFMGNDDFPNHVSSLIGTLSSIPDKPALATIATPTLPNRPTLGNMPNGNPNPGGSGRG